jgi:phosphatidylglycerol:prolipoprotein diacylglycerol transferase
MIPYPAIDPIAIRLGPLSVRWYGLAYIAGFTLGYFILKKRLQETGLKLEGTLPGDFIMTLVFGVLIGARVGYVLFYNPAYYYLHPDQALAFWSGGLSFHGGLIGAILAGFYFCWKHKIDFHRLADTGVVAAPIALGLGRLGNFINGELWGRQSDAPWAMIFPADPTGLPRHPSQLYEFFLEGVVLTAILWAVRNRPMPKGTLFWLFITLYGVFRIFGELFREPDAHLAFILPGITAGMLLSVPMIAVGLWRIAVGYQAWKKPQAAGEATTPA